MATARPGVELAPERKDGTGLVVQVAVNRHAFALFPALNRGHIAIEVGRNLLPRFQTLFGRCRRLPVVAERFIYRGLMERRPAIVPPARIAAKSGNERQVAQMLAIPLIAV